jgi:tetratricopeptide (TPR) repeat protein
VRRKAKLISGQYRLLAMGMALLLFIHLSDGLSRAESNLGFVHLVRDLRAMKLSTIDSIRCLLDVDSHQCPTVDFGNSRAFFLTAIGASRSNASAESGLLTLSSFENDLMLSATPENDALNIVQDASGWSSFWRGFYLYRTGRRDQAVVDWRVVQAGTYFRTQGVFLLRQGSTNCPEAESLLSLAVTIDPNDAEAMFELGRGFQCGEHIVDAINAYRTAAELYSSASARRFLALASAAYLGQNWDVALKAYRQTATSPSAAPYDVLMAYQGIDRVCAEGLRDWQCSVDAVQATFDLLPGDPWPYWRMGEIALARGYIAEASDWFRQAVSLSGNRREAERRLALVWVSAGNQALAGERWQEARHAALEAMAADPDQAGAYVCLGRVAFWGENQPTQAEQYLITATRMDPQSEVAVTWLAVFYRETGRFSQSLALLQAVVETRPGSAETWAQLGLTFYTIGDSEHAAASLEKAIALRVDIPWYYLVLGDAYHSAGRLDDALDAYRRAAQLSPGWQDVADRIRSLEKRP